MCPILFLAKLALPDAQLVGATFVTDIIPAYPIRTPNLDCVGNCGECSQSFKERELRLAMERAIVSVRSLQAVGSVGLLEGSNEGRLEFAA
jgi:hypothetical protein